MIDHPLSVVPFSLGYDLANVACFYSIDAMVIHKLIGGLHLFFIIGDRRRGLVVHDDFHTFTSRICRQAIDVVVGIWFYKAKHRILPFSKPIFPADIPSFYQHAVKAMLSGKINVFFGILSSSTMPAVRFSIFCSASIIPAGFSDVHQPPDTYIFLCLDP